MDKLKYVLILVLFACTSENTKKKNMSIIKQPIELIIFSDGGKVHEGDSIQFSAALKEDSLKVVGIELFLNDSLIAKPANFPFTLKVASNGLKMGENMIKVSATTSSKIENKSKAFTLYAKEAPSLLSYKVIRSIPHDEKAYTQGLIYHEGFLYEGTGQKGQSQLRKISIDNGNVLESHSLEKSIFGEGIAMHNNQIYQLSWQAQVGFVYDLNGLTEMRRFYYEGEGWGLTNDEKFFYRSDGSSRIYLHNLSDFGAHSSIEVYTDKNAVKWLNELEFIDHKIYANIWQTDNIAVINPKNGRVETMIDLKGLLPKKERNSTTDVLNGIAYDTKNDRLFVTGKNWPKIYEIKLIPES